MDKFKYLAHCKKLDTCSTVKELEQLLRDHHRIAQHFKWQYQIKDAKSYEKVFYSYKLYSKALNLFSNRSKKKLPDFLYDDLKTIQQSLTTLIADDNIDYAEKQIPFFAKLPYEKILDLFEFDSEVELNSNNFHLHLLDDIIKDKSIHFKFVSNTGISTFSKYSLKNVKDNNLKKYIAAINHKQSGLNNAEYTVSEAYIAELKQNCYLTPKQIPDLDNCITDLKNQIAALETVKAQCNE